MPSISNNFATSLNIVFQFSSIRYASFKRLDPCNERMVYIYCYGMGREFIFKAQIDPTKTHNYKTKCIMEQLDVQKSFNIKHVKESHEQEKRYIFLRMI